MHQNHLSVKNPGFQGCNSGYITFYELFCLQLEVAYGALSSEKAFQTQDVSALFPCNALVEVVVGEVYSPDHFWIMHHGSSTSQLLDSLMDCMMSVHVLYLCCNVYCSDRVIIFGVSVL